MLVQSELLRLAKCGLGLRCPSPPTAPPCRLGGYEPETRRRAARAAALDCTPPQAAGPHRKFCQSGPQDIEFELPFPCSALQVASGEESPRAASRASRKDSRSPGRTRSTGIFRLKTGGFDFNLAPSTRDRSGAVEARTSAGAVRKMPLPAARPPNLKIVLGSRNRPSSGEAAPWRSRQPAWP